MKKRYGFGIIAIAIILMIGGCECTMNNSALPNNDNTEFEETLNERQKSILSEQGLPTEYGELSSSQQRAIVSIEKMLLYVEDKYNTSFSYAGYSAASTLEKEHMRAFPTSGDMETDSFTITKSETGYEDDYINMAANKSYSNYVYEGIKKMIPDTEVKVFTEVTKISLLEVPTISSDFDGKVESSLWIFIDGATLTENNLNDFKERFIEFMKKHELYGIAQIIFLKEGEIAYLARYNYTDYLSDGHFVGRDTVYINK